ncbi:molecular chaperone TorD family protein [Tropicimonas isoalkanivorans]|uniref:DMSO reductase family type II enzyme chaperone n=1 Tax=Tropicimonas isoalkanivorans TaxID=441112 RepID=A0A1I1HR19_9RHOB|nr:molecular chaperone TorD family protein [Tropicimonas isoalkanivorans]SFC26255.1 DMSO reductase family type II enzyme chaperone [Tropicimonas isoalkanivorans]
MSVLAPPPVPHGESAERAHAKETVWRLGALAFGHPIPSFQEALQTGAFHAAFDEAWSALTGRRWPREMPSESFAALESGYIAAFEHGPGGKRLASLLAGEHEEMLGGLARPAYMLNVAAFYRHFGLKQATEDEGRVDEPDHVACLLEFMAVLAHLEAQAIAVGKSPDPLRRAQRDFLSRYVAPLLALIGTSIQRPLDPVLDPTIARLIRDLHGLAELQIAELEARVGPYRRPDGPRQTPARDEAINQNLWG